MSRVSTAQIFEQAAKAISDARFKEAKTAERVATQKEIVRPSQDPQGWRIAKDARDEEQVRQVLGKNGKLAMSYLEATEGLLSDVHEGLTRAYELTIAASDKLYDPAQVRGIEEEIKQIFEAVVQTVNMRYGARTLLGGHKSTGRAFTNDGRFVGDGGKIFVELEKNHLIQVNLSGQDAILGKSRQDGIDILNSFRGVLDGFQEKDIKLVRQGITDFKQGIEQISMARAELGAKMAAVDTALETNEQHRIDLLELASSLDEIDVAKVFSELARDQTALRAALTSSERLIKEVPPDLLYR